MHFSNSKDIYSQHLEINLTILKGRLISIKMDQKAWLPKNATQKLPQIVLEESIGIGMLILTT